MTVDFSAVKLLAEKAIRNMEVKSYEYVCLKKHKQLKTKNPYCFVLRGYSK
jgi:hypothetical protein